MKLTRGELEYLSAWAREEWEPDCYQRPAHRLQLAHGVKGGQLIDLIKAWTEAEGKPDQAILEAASNPDPTWPWKSSEEFGDRLSEAQKLLPAIFQRTASGQADAPHEGSAAR